MQKLQNLPAGKEQVTVGGPTLVSKALDNLMESINLPEQVSSPEEEKEPAKISYKNFELGYDDGYKASTNDLINGYDIDLSLFDERDLRDFYSLGYELGYKTKLAE
jgi:hypothetical protein